MSARRELHEPPTDNELVEHLIRLVAERVALTLECGLCREIARRLKVVPA